MAIVKSGPFLGAYGVNAGATITFDWEPDPIEISDRVLNVMDALEERHAPLLAAGQFVSGDIRENFRGQHDPGGDEWQEWSGGRRFEGQIDPESGKEIFDMGYAAYAKRVNLGKILEQTLALRESTVNPARIRITNNDVFYDTGGLPHGWLWHQEGLPDRRTAAGAENPLPKRSFLGLSDSAAIDIMVVFDDWFTGAITLFTTKTGRIGRRHSLRGAGGRFVER